MLTVLRFASKPLYYHSNESVNHSTFKRFKRFSECVDLMLLNLDIELIRAVNLNIALLLAQLFFSQVSNHFVLNSKFHKVHSYIFQ